MRRLEEIIVGSLIQEPQLIKKAVKVIEEDDFYETDLKSIYNVLLDLHSKSEAIDMITVSVNVANLKISPALVSGLVTSIGSTSNISDHLLKLKEVSIRRKLIELADSFKKQATENKDVFEVIETIKNSLLEIEPVFYSGINNMDKLLEEVNKRIEENTKGITGLMTGLIDFDRFSNGMQKGDLVVVAGETSQGKTSLALSMAFNQIMDGKNVAFYSYEMSSVQIAARMVSIASKVSSKHILMRALSDGEYRDVNEAFTKLMDKHLFVVETIESSYNWLEHSIKSMVDTYGIDCAYVDYLQLITMRDMSRKDSASHSANSLKRLAKSSAVDIPIVALSQLRRDPSNPKPALDRLKESGDIENASDTVIGIWRPDHYGFDRLEAANTEGEVNSNGLGLLNVLKGRNIGLVSIAVNWSPENTYYSNYNKSHFIKSNFGNPF